MTARNASAAPVEQGEIWGPQVPIEGLIPSRPLRSSCEEMHYDTALDHDNDLAKAADLSSIRLRTLLHSNSVISHV